MHGTGLLIAIALLLLAGIGPEPGIRAHLSSADNPSAVLPSAPGREDAPDPYRTLDSPEICLPGAAAPETAGLELLPQSPRTDCSRTSLGHDRDPAASHWIAGGAVTRLEHPPFLPAPPRRFV